MALILLHIHWEGIAGDGSWSNYLRRVGQMALILYAVMVFALVNSHAHPRKRH